MTTKVIKENNIILTSFLTLSKTLIWQLVYHQYITYYFYREVIIKKINFHSYVLNIVFLFQGFIFYF